MAHTVPAKDVAERGKTFQAMLGQSYMQLASKDYKGAAVTLRAIIADPKFASEPGKARLSAYYLLSQALYQTGDTEGSYTVLLQGGDALPEQRDGQYWMVRAAQAFGLQKTEDAADSLAEGVKTAPQFLTAFGEGGDDLVRDVTGKAFALKGGGAHALGLMEALWAAHYRPQNAFKADDILWFHLFELYAAKGEDDKAKTVLASLHQPRSVIALRADKRYARFVADGPGKGDFMLTLTQYLDETRALAAANPTKLEGVVTLASRLVEANQAQQAMDVLDAAGARIEAAPKDKPAFDDIDMQMNWVLDARAEALLLLGKSNGEDSQKAVVDAQKQANDIAQAKGFDVVSQRINLADIFFQHNENQKAADLLADIDLTQASPYGIMAAQEARVCAYSGLGDKTNATKALDYMKAHAGDSEKLLRAALLCSGDLDGLANLLIANLDDPVTRNATLIQLQNYLPDKNPSTFLQQENKKAREVWGRPDVQTAVARYGVIDTYPVIAPFN